MWELVKEADKVFHKRETEEEKEQRKEAERELREDKRDQKRDRALTKILATAVDRREVRVGRGRGRGRQRESRDLGPHLRPQLDQDQCAYCKEKGHWT